MSLRTATIFCAVAFAAAGSPFTSTSGWREGEPANFDDRLVLTFFVHETNKDKLKKLAEEVSNPESKEYGHYLNKSQVDSLTAPHPGDIAVVESALNGTSYVVEEDGAIIRADVTIMFAEQLLGGKFVYFCPIEQPHVRRLQDANCLLRNPTAQVPERLRKVCDLISPLDDPLPTFARPGPVESPEEKGCCFTIGFGDLMKPCCLRTAEAHSSVACQDSGVLGGNSGYHAGACPVDADKAAELLKGQRHSKPSLAAHKPLLSAVRRPLMSSVRPALGCCYAIGFGNLMKPCCLKTWAANTISQCGDKGSPEQMVGGSAGFNASGCPSTADEAATWKSDAPAALATGHPKLSTQRAPDATKGSQMVEAAPVKDGRMNATVLWVVGFSLGALVGGVAIGLVMRNRSHRSMPLLPGDGSGLE